MRLINTHTLEMQSFNSPEVVPGGYAILSHCWDEGGEQSFKDIQKVRKRCASSESNLQPRDLVCDKIRQFCDLAKDHGYEWAWIDTCCIDKTSSSELSEAINSMYRYYSFADICYVYLKDVLTTDALVMRERHFCDGAPYIKCSTPFQDSRWHTRGWTLQELIAPRLVLFLSQSWEVLGTKADLAEQLTGCTSIPIEILRLEKTPTDFSVAQRMSWAADRTTTRLEDEAYCLLGIFDMHMPTLYGEGRKAFRRLQEEIMKKSADTTLYAWFRDPNSVHCENAPDYGLVASSPADFRNCDVQEDPSDVGNQPLS